MTTIGITDAKALGQRAKAKGIVIIEFKENGQFKLISWGKDKKHCGFLGRWVDQISDEIAAGIIRAPDWD